VPVRRAGPDRARIDYDEPFAAAKRRLLATINAERESAGARPLAYDLVGAKAGDAFCREEAEHRFTGHWDLEGRAPYVRWAEAGGVDYEAENAAGRSRGGGAFRESVEELLLATHRLFMEERPPDDLHKETVLDPAFTHVGIGAAVLGGEFRMTEEFSRHVAEWIEVPAAPVAGVRAAPFAAQLPRGWSVGAVGIAFEPPPRPMTARQIERRAQYGYPRAVRSLRPLLPANQRWSDGSRGDFPISSGRVSLDVPLDRGPGFYFVMVYAGPGAISGRSLSPITAAAIEVR